MSINYDILTAGITCISFSIAWKTLEKYREDENTKILNFITSLEDEFNHIEDWAGTKKTGHKQETIESCKKNKDFLFDYF